MCMCVSACVCVCEGVCMSVCLYQVEGIKVNDGPLE